MNDPKAIGLLHVCGSNDLDDQAMARVIGRVFATAGVAHRVVDPFKPSTRGLAGLVIGGGRLLRGPDDPDFRAFRPRGRHVLNAVAVDDATDTDYLREYALVGVRTQADRERLGMGEVQPCLSLIYGDYLAPGDAPTLPEGVIGVHLTADFRHHARDTVHALASAGATVVWLAPPGMDDPSLLAALEAAVPNSRSIGLDDPDRFYRLVGQLQGLMTATFVGASFAWAQRVPLIGYGYSSEVGDFLRDRGQAAALVTEPARLQEKITFLTSGFHEAVRLQNDLLQCRMWRDRMLTAAGETLAIPSAEPFCVRAADPSAWQRRRTANDREISRVVERELQVLQVRQIEAELYRIEQCVDARATLIDGLRTQAERDLAGRERGKAEQQSDLRRELARREKMLSRRFELLERRQQEDASAQRALLAQQQFDIAHKQTVLNAALALPRRRPSTRRIRSVMRRLLMPLIRLIRRTTGLARRGEADFAYGLECELSERFVGNGAVLPVQGWCFLPGARIRALTIIVGERRHPVIRHSMPRPDVFEVHFPAQESSGESLFSGFKVAAPIPPADAGKRLPIRIEIASDNGDVVVRNVGEVVAKAGNGRVPLAVSWPSAGTRIAICMTTCDPPLDLFEEQVRSIVEQTHRNWICIIRDDRSGDERYAGIERLIGADARFHLYRNERRLGFYANFEACLDQVPSDAQMVALSDHDDRWYPDKLQTLLDGFEGDTQLVYSDCRLVRPDGSIIADSYWTRRKNNFTDFTTMMVANTVTGAASMFRSTLLDEALPFPPRIGDAYHDQWLALVAMVSGRIRYVDRPLYDYVQHGGNVIGHFDTRAPGVGDALHELFKGSRHGAVFPALRQLLLSAIGDHWFVHHKEVVAKTLLLRFPGMDPEQRKVLLRYRRAGHSLPVMAAEALRAKFAQRSTLNLENFMLRTVAGSRLARPAFRLRQGALMEGRIRQLAEGAAGQPAAGMNPVEAGSERIKATDYGDIGGILHHIRPFRLDISADHPRRVNMLLGMIDFRYVFGGYIGMFNFALRLRAQGYAVRIIVTESADFNPEEWRWQVRRFAGLETLFDAVEVVSGYDRDRPIAVHPHDDFIATSCWNAHPAWHAANELGRGRFVFMVQEYEPIFIPHNSINALLMQAYDFPQFDVFSTELLRDYFKQQRIGIYREGSPGDASSAVFRNAIQAFQPTLQSFEHEKRRLLFYARPEGHAARNLFELGIMGLVELMRDGRIDLTHWSFHGIGSIDQKYTIELARGVDLQLVPRTTLDEYTALLPTFDVGLSLMLSPHPSLVPLEMAAAGMCTVTNTFANKTADALTAISTNLIAVPPTVEGIAEGLYQAILRADDIDARLAGAKIDWPTSWNDAFADESMARLREFLDH